MSARVEGRITFDGLVEGRMPADARLAELLRAWTEKAQRDGLVLDLEIEGGRFGLLAGTEPASARQLGDVPSARVRELLERLVALFPDKSDCAFFSTLRSVETRPGREVQTVYVIRPDGTVQTPERVLEAPTIPPERAARRRRSARAVTVALLLLAVGLGAGLVLQGIAGDGRPAPRFALSAADLDALEVNAGAFGPFLAPVDRAIGAGGHTLSITLIRKAAWPKDEAAWARAYEEAAADPRRRVALDALLRGYVVVEIRGGGGAILGHVSVRVAGLADADTTAIAVPIPANGKPTRLLLR